MVVLSNANAAFAFPAPRISPDCYLQKSGRHMTSLDQDLSFSKERSRKSLGTRYNANIALSPVYTSKFYFTNLIRQMHLIKS
jgi:hypothetical protein